MLKTKLELNLRVLFGLVIAIIGLIILGNVVIIAFQLATGAIQPLKLNPSMDSEIEVLFGIVLQMGALGILIAVAFIMLSFGVKLILHKEWTKPQQLA